MFPENWSLARIIRHALCEILVEHSINRKVLKQILANQENMMSALDDTKAAITAVSGKLTKLSTDVEAFITANSGGATDTDLQGLTAAVGQLGTAVDAIDAIVNPPAPSPTPAPTPAPAPAS